MKRAVALRVVALGTAAGLGAVLSGCSTRPTDSPPQIANADGSRQPRAESDLVLLDLDGHSHHPLATTASTQALVFITRDCPIANRYAPDLLALQEHIGDRPVELILVHVDPDVNHADAVAHATEYGYAGKIPIVLDSTHQWVSALQPKVTPEAFVLTGGRVRYRGRIDDSFPKLGKRRASPGTPDLRNAIEAVLAGRDPSPARTRAVGCRITELHNADG